MGLNKIGFEEVLVNYLIIWHKMTLAGFDYTCGILHVHHRVYRWQATKLILNHLLVFGLLTQYLLKERIDICDQSSVHFITFLG